MIWGHGITVKGTKYVRELSKMDPSTLEVQTIKVLDTLAVDAGNFVTLDVESQTMYWISSLFKDEPGGNPPFCEELGTLVTCVRISSPASLGPQHALASGWLPLNSLARASDASRTMRPSVPLVRSFADLVQVSLEGAIVSQTLACQSWNYPWNPGSCPSTLDWA